MQQPFTFPLQGGYDLVTPAVSARPGSLVGGYNYEPDADGYRRFSGWERLDGRAKPHLAVYAVLPFTAGSTAILAGQTVTTVGGFSAIALLDAVVETGTWGAGTAAGYVVVGDPTGSTATGDTLRVSGSPVATAEGPATEGGASNDTQDAAWSALAVARRRALIGKPAGQGPVRAVWTFGADVFCIRDAAGGASAVLFKATSSGWVAQSLGSSIAFTAGTGAITEGSTLALGGASAPVRRVQIVSGSWSGGDAAGWLSIGPVTGGPFTAGAATATGGGAATLSGAEVANVLPPGGRYEIVVHNFYGAAGWRRCYGANGVGRAFEYDALTGAFMWLRTGLSDALDKPQHIAEFRNHLWLGYAAGSWQHSATGDPVDWRALTGAGEIAVGSEVTGSIRSDSALILLALNRIDYVTGFDADSWDVKPLTEDAGALRWSAIMGPSPLYMEDGALRRLTASDAALGGWRMTALSSQITPLMKAITGRGAKPAAAMRVRARDLWRVFLDDGTALSVYLGRKNPEIIPLDLPAAAFTAWASPKDDGRETQLVGLADGWVCETDVGADFDGAPIEYLIRMADVLAGAPRYEKRWHSMHLEITGPPSATIRISTEVDHGDPDAAPARAEAFEVRSGGGFWNTAIWNEFYWSTQVVGQAHADLDANGRAISIAVYGETTGELPHTLRAASIHATNRRLVRGLG
jgi:hypothetical protein